MVPPIEENPLLVVDVIIAFMLVYYMFCRGSFLNQWTVEIPSEVLEIEPDIKYNVVSTCLHVCLQVNVESGFLSVSIKTAEDCPSVYLSVPDLVSTFYFSFRLFDTLHRKWKSCIRPLGVC